MKKIISLVFAGMVGGLMMFGGLCFTQSELLQSNKAGNSSYYAAPVNQRINTPTGRNDILPTFTEVAEAAMPVVVHISAAETERLSEKRDPNSRRIDPFDFFFNDDFFENFPLDMPLRKGTGSGVIYSDDGYIITNNHVIEFADVVNVTLYDERTFQAEVVGIDPRTDLAVLKIDAEGLPTLPFADSEKAKVGEWVLAVGNPFDLTSTVTAGIVSAKGRDIDIIRRRDAIESFIQTDAAVNPGNSGGALVDAKGKLLGINTAIASPTGAFAGYSFAIPSNLIKDIVENIINYGGPRVALGVMVSDVNQELANELGLPAAEGVFISSLVDGGAAQYAGVLPNDVIKKINGKDVKNFDDLKSIIDNSKVGDQLTLEVYRKGRAKNIPVKLKAEQVN